MEAELKVERPDLSIELHGVNETGHESGNAQACAGRSLPWLQDDAATNAYVRWQVTYRDVVVLDEVNRVEFIHNLTSHDLAVAANYNQLKAALIAAAGG